MRLEKMTNGVGQKAAIAEADLAGHLKNKDSQEMGSVTREHESNISDDTLKDNQVLDAINLLKNLHILGQQTSATGEPKTKQQDKTQ